MSDVKKRGRPKTVFKELSKTAKSNREWHFEYWKEAYEEIPAKYSQRMWQLVDLYGKIAELGKEMQRTERSRIEHTKTMGVPREDSDKVFNLSKQIESIPIFMAELEKTAKQYGIKLPTIEDL